MYLLALIVIPSLAALVTPLLRPWIGKTPGSVLALVPAALFAWTLVHFGTIVQGRFPSLHLDWLPQMGIHLSLGQDGLSLLFTLLITGIGTLIFLYADRYLDPEEDRSKFFTYLFLFVTAMLGVVTARNLVALYFFWEMTSIVSFLLIGFWFHRKESREGALKALLVTTLGGFAMLAGFILIYIMAGTQDIAELVAQAPALLEHPLYPLALVLVLLGAFTKSAQVPFHLWLPSAMEAPTPVSAFLHSATMVKAGLYLLLRFGPILGGSELWFWIISITGIVTLFWASAVAIRQTDLKALLAFSTISQLGLIMALIGWGTPLAIIAACTHIINHAVFKAALFMVVGIVDHSTGTRDVRVLRNLSRAMPITGLIAWVTALALAGVPGLNGFVSKELFLEASLESMHSFGGFGWIFPLLAVLGSTLTFVYSLIFSHGVFNDRSRNGDAVSEGVGSTPTSDVHDPSWGLLLPPIILAGLTLLLGWIPQTAIGRLVQSAADVSVFGTYNEPFQLHALPTAVTPAFLMSVAIIVIGLLLYRFRQGFVPAWRAAPVTPNVNQVYEGFLDMLALVARKQTRFFMSGFLADSIGFIMAFVLLTVVLAFVFSPSTTQWLPDLAPYAPFEIAVITLGIAAALATLFVGSRLTALLTLGTVGLTIITLFVFVQAPDLALTQLIVESVSLILFLLVFKHLPKLTVEQTSWRIKVRRLLLSVMSGGAVGALLLWVNATPAPPKEITQYYIDNSVELAGGYNIVNVILVDFRGFDTMGEITVIAIAALGVYALVKLRPGGKES